MYCRNKCPYCREEDFGLYLSQIRFLLHSWKYVLYQDAVILGQVGSTYCIHFSMKTPIDVLAGGGYAFGNKKLPEIYQRR